MDLLGAGDFGQRAEISVRRYEARGLVRAWGADGVKIAFSGLWRTCMFEGLFQPMHLLVIFFIALLVFGPKKLPELGKGIGEGIRALKDGMKETPADPAKDSTKEIKS